MDKIVSSKKFKRVAALILAAVTILSMFFALPVSAKTEIPQPSPLIIVTIPAAVLSPSQKPLPTEV